MEEEIKSESPYKERLALIYSGSSSPPGFRKDIGMQDIYEFDALQGRKHQLYKTVHVTGTNGKGSACMKISSALSFAGYKVGRFVSPHISSCRERISVNGELISEQDFVICADNVLDLLGQNPHIKLKFSEKLFFIALGYFAMKEVDVAVIQVSCGGKHDSTIVITPVLSVITSVSLDHVEMLGPTVEDIAKEKSAIIKPKVPCVLGPKAIPKEVFLKVAEDQGSQAFCVELPLSSSKPVSFAEVNKQIARQALEIL